MMRGCLSATLLLLWGFCLSLVAGQRHNNYTTEVEWDEHSLWVQGERVYIYAGEFHYQRLPNPDLWRDVMQKFKANGLNALSIYFFWSYHSPQQDVFDFESPGKDIQLLFDMAKEEGLYVIARPGPYCNAETNAGGIALWASDGSGGDLRTADETYHEAWLPWMEAVGKIIARNQITEGGPIILVQVENEYTENTHDPDSTEVRYMEQIETQMRDIGIVVPTNSNEKGMRGQSWSVDYQNVGGAVDVYGLDSYPGGLSCTNPDTGFTVVRTYYQWFQNYSWTQPEYFPEFQGGWFSPWGGDFYDTCESQHDPAFPDVYYKNNIGQRTSLMSFYMTFGGTNWGHSAAPVVYTSYDYSAPLRETREMWDTMKQLKLIGLFTRVSDGLVKTDMESNGTGNAVNTSSIFTWVLKNPDTSARFYVTQQNNTKSRDVVPFTLSAKTSVGTVDISTMDLQGRQSRIIVTDYPVGDKTLIYSSAQVLTYGLFDSEVLVFYLDAGQVGELAFDSSLENAAFNTYGEESDFSKVNGNATSAAFTYTQGEGATIVKFDNGPVLYLLDTTTAYTFFAPATTADPKVTPDEQVFVMGPYLVRSVSVSGDMVSINGDNTNTTTLEVYVGDSNVDTINWNGNALDTTQTDYGSLKASLAGIEDREVALPTLSGWKVADSLPETDRSYDDSQWTVANKTTTLNPVKPLTLPVLYGADYDFFTGIYIYRGYFDGSSANQVNITASGGVAAGWSAWVNGQHIGGHPGDPALTITNATLNFNNATLFSEGNVLTVLTDYSGHDEDSQSPYGPENPRGLLGVELLESGSSLEFTQWKIQGNAGGSKGYIDPVRGPMNEGGLYGERLGWHLPGFSDSDWQSGSPSDGLQKAGVNWYNTKFTLNIDEDLDAPIGVELGAPEGAVARVQLFVNGYQYGKFWSHIGPQTRFPVPPGILNNRGENHLSLSLWAQSDDGASLDTVQLINYGKYQSNFDFSKDWSASLQPSWTEDRLKYA